MVHTDLIAIKYLMADRNLDHPIDRSIIIDRLIDNVIVSLPVVLLPGIVGHSLSDLMSGSV